MINESANLTNGLKRAIRESAAGGGGFSLLLQRVREGRGRAQ